MSSIEISPVSSKERIEILDVLRGLAVCGILIGNLQWFSGYGRVPAELLHDSPLYNQITHFLVHFFIEGKFYSIFSFLFGVGFALQISRAEDRGDANASLFKRRLVWLLIIGLLHAYLLWGGDILSIYAVMGFVLILFRKKSNESLLKWAVVMMAIPVITYALLYAALLAFAHPDAIAGFADKQLGEWNTAVDTVARGSYWEIISTYNLDYVVGRYEGLLFQMRLPKVLAMFLLGMYAYRIGVFQDLKAHAALIKKVLIYGAIFGLIGNIAMAGLAGNEAPFPPSPMTMVGVIGYSFGVPALALFIMALIATLWQMESWRSVLKYLAPVGRMALTNYLLQTVICVTIFYGYGFGMFGTIGALKATLLALTIFAVQIILSSIWMRYFAYGPMEWIWRQLAYGRRLSLRREPDAITAAAVKSKSVTSD